MDCRRCSCVQAPQNEWLKLSSTGRHETIILDQEHTRRCGKFLGMDFSYPRVAPIDGLGSIESHISRTKDIFKTVNPSTPCRHVQHEDHILYNPSSRQPTHSELISIRSRLSLWLRFGTTRAISQHRASQSPGFSCACSNRCGRKVPASTRTGDLRAFTCGSFITFDTGRYRRE